MLIVEAVSLIMAADPRDLASRVKEMGGRRERFPPISRSCRTRRQGTEDITRTAAETWLTKDGGTLVCALTC